MKKYYLHNGTEQEGPFDFDELKSKKITKETPIWYEGLADWTTAGKVEELKSLFVPTPPPLLKQEPKVSSSVPPPVKATKKKSKTALYIIIALVAFVFVVGIVIISQILRHKNNSSYSSSSYENNYETQVMSVEQMEQAEPTKFLSARGNYNLNFWGDKIKIQGEIVSSATVAKFKDAIVRVTYYSKTKTELGSKDYTIYELFKPNSAKRFELKIDNYANVSSIGCDVVGATVSY